MPLINGFKSAFYGTQYNYESKILKFKELVLIQFSVENDKPLSTNSVHIIGKLPEGFRPNSVQHNVIFSYSPHNFGYVAVVPNGDIHTFIVSSNTMPLWRIYGSCCYYI